MIYPDYLTAQVFKFCKDSNIPIDGGYVSKIDAEKTERFIHYQMTQNRNRTGHIERTRVTITDQDLKKMFNLCESPIEDYLLQAMVDVGLDKHCRPQFEIGKKRVDFAFPIAKLAVECDGKAYHFTDQTQIEKDQERDKYLARKGWRVLHIEGLAIRRNIELCIKKIVDQIRPFIPDFTYDEARLIRH